MQKPYTEIIVKRSNPDQGMIVHTFKGFPKAPSDDAIEIVVDAQGNIYEIKVPGQILEARYFNG